MTATLQFHSALYAEEALAASVEAFAEVAKISVSKADGGYDVVTFDMDDGDDENEIVGSFANYVLAITIESKRNG